MATHNCCRPVVDPNLPKIELKDGVSEVIKQYVDFRGGKSDVFQIQEQNNEFSYFTQPELFTLFNAGAASVKLKKPNRYTVVIGETKEAFLQLRELVLRQLSDEKRKIWQRYGYLPLNSRLPPKMRLPCEHTEHVTKELLDVFVNAPSNVTYDGEYYAANCRHRVSKGDEHPWCMICVMRAGLTPTCADDCYICEAMSEEFFSLRESLRAKYMKEDDTSGMVQTKSIPLRKGVVNQAQADICEEVLLGTLGVPVGGDGAYKGYINSALRKPYYSTFSHSVGMYAENRERCIAFIKKHFEYFNRQYDAWRAKRAEERKARKKERQKTESGGKKPTRKSSRVKGKSSDETKQKSSSKLQTQSKGKRKQTEDSESEMDKTPLKKRVAHRKVPASVTRESKTLGKWAATSMQRLTRFSAAEKNNAHFDYSEAANGAVDLKPDTPFYTVERRQTSEQRRRLKLVPSKLVLDKVNRAMYRYVDAPSIFKPDLESTSRHHDDLVVESQISTQVLENTEDREGKLPTDHCLMFLTQQEIRRHEYLCRQQCKALEISEPLVVALDNALDQLQEGPANAIRAVVDGIKNAHSVHMDAATEMLGSIIQQRRRDQCIRGALTLPQVDAKWSILHPPNDSVQQMPDTLV